VPFYGLKYGECYGEPNPACPDSVSMDIRIELIEYVF